MIRILQCLAVLLLVFSPATAQIFDRQFNSVDSFQSGDSQDRTQAFRTFVGRHAFGGTSALPVGGFFGCNGQGGGECAQSRPAPPPPGSEGGSANDEPDQSANDEASCP